MDKFKKEAVRGIQSHNQRERQSRSNPEIDYRRSRFNYDLNNVSPVNYQRVIEARLDSLNLKKAIRHDAVHMFGLIVSSDAEFFARLGEAKIRDFFEAAKGFLERFVGPENVISAVVHMDEKTPHLHFVHVPVTADGRLNANKIYTREILKKLQTELPRYLKDRGFDIQRGVEQKPGAARKHLDTREFKQQQEALSSLKNEAAEARHGLESIQKEVARIQQMKAAESARLKEVSRQAQEAENILRQEHGLPKPGFLVSKSNYQQALTVIERQKQALADKNQVLERNRYLEAQQAKTDHRIAAIEEAATNKIQQHEEALKAVKAELRRREESHKSLVEQYSRAFDDYRRHKEEDEARKKEARAQEAIERSRRRNEEARQRAQERPTDQAIGALKPEAAVPPEPEKKPGFTLGR
jgi:hypothetical protein